jgi:thiamine biosynthesis lipoprotein
MFSKAHEERILVEQSQRIMATAIGVHVAVAAGAEAQALAAIADCMAWFHEVDHRLSRFAPESELSRLNACAGQWCPVSEVLFEVVEQSVAAAEASDGLFDPTILPVLEALGYDRDFNEIAYREAPTALTVKGESDAVGAPGSWRRIGLNRARHRVRLPPGVRLDFGGIAKGWAADVALERCFCSLPDVLIDVGGDVRARGGTQDGELWAIGIGDPRPTFAAPEASAAQPAVPHVAVLTIGRGGLATSGATWRWWYRAGERQHHLIDPRTGRPARLWVDEGDQSAGTPPLIASVTALATTAAHAEVAAKVALLRGFPQALTVVDTAWRASYGSDPHGAGDPYGDADVALLMLLGTGEVACSANLPDYLAALGGGGDIWMD